ncbi:putative ribosome biogenesis GTPase RsgA [Tersicoccus solisilvae]|uniref:Small ribosomal subunit biogenesis GTPase RsgA n=1 Tax=Tersicoccus solisilvae TaxID=1882339 RepID=A0ABQ1P197_9MICC|nr:ribosome small subunit-dependent GTPase A [Tersicoccus solisilvae]GGC87026.1 putative ribosome biogenesis GTPase RsgA [Tersicoccus solisilvae]
MSGREWDESDVRIRPNKRGTRPRTKDRPEHRDAVVGRIVTVDRGRYTTVVDEDTADERVVIAARARELRRTAIVPGDEVDLVGDVSGTADTLARLVRIRDRRTVLRRSADDTDPVERVVVANADQLVIVTAAARPEPRTGFVDRALVAAYDAGIAPLLCLTKADLADPAPFLANYAHLDLPVVISRAGSAAGEEDDAALDPEAIEALRRRLDGRISVLIGHSGVGKSTLVNALSDAGRATGTVNDVTGRGRHTSSSALAIRLADGAAGSWIIDTPGIRSFGLAHVSADTLLRAFDDLEPGAEQCPRGCEHRSPDDGCELDGWVADGGAGPAGPARLASFRRLLGVGADAAAAQKELGAAEAPGPLPSR